MFNKRAEKEKRMWLLLHILETNTKVYINSDQILAFREDNDGTIIELPGSDEYYYLVKESTDEILRKLDISK